jgi:O-antigen biosynthesis protein
MLGSLPLMPEWYFLVGSMVLLSLLGIAWTPLLWLAPVALLAVGATLWQACQGAMRADFRGRTLTPGKIWRLRATVAWLHLLQPLARLQGRIMHGIGPWRRRDLKLSPSPAPREDAFWSEEWVASETRLTGIENELRLADRPVRAGGDFDRWDLTVQGGLLGGLRAVAMVEEHGAGRQLFRLKAWPTTPRSAWLSVTLLSALALLAARDEAWLAAGPLAAVALAFAGLIYASCASATAAWVAAINAYAAGAGLIPLGASLREAPPPPDAEVVPFVAAKP